MAKLLKLRRGTTSQHSSFTGAEGEVTIDTTKDTAVVHDGSQAGGRPLAREDMNNVPAGTILGTQLENSGVTAGSYGSSSAIPIVTVDAQGLVTAASTTAIDSTTIANGTSSVAVANNGDITATRSGTARLAVNNAGVNVTGRVTASDLTVQNNSGNLSAFFTSGNGLGTLEVGGTTGAFIDLKTPASDDYDLRVDASGTLTSTAGITLNTASGQSVTVGRNLDVGAGVDVTGNITVSGTVDGVDIAALKTAKDSLSTTNGALVNGVTATTQSAGDNSTKVATTGYVRSAITAHVFPSGTKMIFQQTSAPTGWTKVTSSVDNKALRVVSGTAGSGGSNAFTNTLASRGINANSGNTTAGGNVSVSVANATQGGNVSVGNTTAGGNLSISSVSTGGNVNSHTLSVNEIASHSHAMIPHGQQDQRGNAGTGAGNQRLNYNVTHNTSSAGGNGGHSHGFSGSSHSHNGSLSGTAHNHNASFSGSAHNHNANGSFSGTAHNHSISVGNLDMAVQYLDVIIATKD